MINNLEKIQELLKTKKQTFHVLCDSEGGVCIQGILALAWGGKVIDTGLTYNKITFLEIGQTFSISLPDFIINNNGLLARIPVTFIESIELSDRQKKILSKHGEFDKSWFYLNDILNLTFDQFSQLLNKIEKEEEKECT
jgi:hypothetical protein